MSQNNEQQLPVISIEKIESIKALPTVLDANKDLLSKAKATCKPIFDKIIGLDFKAADLIATDELEKQANDLQVRLRKAKETAENRRKPATSSMDEIKSLFTANEKEFDDIFSQLKAFRDTWNKEKARRNEESEKEKQRLMAVTKEKNDYYAAACTHFMNRVFEIVKARKKTISDEFSNLTLENIDKFETAYRGWIPAFNQSHIDFVQKNLLFTTNFISGEERNNSFFTAFNNSLKLLETEYVSKMKEERDRIVEMIPAKKIELQKIANSSAEDAAQIKQQAVARDQQEQHRQDDLLKQQQQEKVTDIAATAQSQTVSSMFGIMTGNAAQPAASVSKGTKQKQSISITSNSGWLTMLQLYGLKRAPSAPLDALEKELKAVLKWATEYLNEGGQIPESDGIKIEKTFSTTAKK